MVGVCGMKSFLWAAAAAIAASAVIALAPADAQSSAARHRCKDVVIYYNGAVYTRTDGLWGIRAGCRTARRWLKHAEGSIRTPHPYGFHCRSIRQGYGTLCRKGHRRVVWHYRR